MNLVQRAATMMKADKFLAEDAIKGSKVDNSVLGGVLSMSTGVPRWLAEDAVRKALEIEHTFNGDIDEQ